MRRRIIPVILILVMMLSVSVFALEQRAGVRPTLSFSGTTATCSVTIAQANADIDVTLELWCGNTFVDSWSDSGRNGVKVKGTCQVTRGNTYTLIASGTINGTPFESTPVEKTCN